MRFFPSLAAAFVLCSAFLARGVAQTVYIPNGTSGISSIAGSNVGIGTNAPGSKLEVAGDIRSSGSLVEKKVVFTPTTVGWYRVVSGLGGTGLAQAGGTIRISGAYDGTTTSQEFVYNIRGYGQGGSLTLIKNSGVNGGLINKARISTNGTSTMYLDLYVSTATAPSPITVYGYGPDSPAFVGSPVVGAVAGSTNVRILPLDWSPGDEFRTTANVMTYASDGLTTQGYIFHGSAGQAAFGNGVVNGETWITRSGGAGSIKIGEYDFSNSFLTVTGVTGNVGVGTNAPFAKLHVQKDGAVVTDYALAQLMVGGTDGNKRLALAYDTTNNVGLIQAYVHGGTTQNLVLQSAGGNVGIGTATPSHKLAVNGTIRAKEVIVDTGWADYVFEDDYRLAPLSEVESHIREKKHLPGIPSANEIAAHGVSMGEMQAKLLAKIEELTLHVIAQGKQLETQRGQITELQAQNVNLSQTINALRSR